jgi:hypothetical protein
MTRVHHLSRPQSDRRGVLDLLNVFLFFLPLFGSADE